jgi:hypothetical protein
MAPTLQDLERMARKDPRTATYVANLSKRLSSVLERAWDAQFRNHISAVQDSQQELTQIVGPNDPRRSMVDGIVSRYLREAAKPHPRPFILEVISLFRPDLKPSTLASYAKGKQRQGKTPRLSSMHEIVDVGSFEVILKTINVFKFLNYVDNQCDSGEKCASAFVSSFYASQYPGWAHTNERIPFLQLATTLVLLTPVFIAATAVSNSEWESLGLAAVNGLLDAYQPLDGPYREPNVRDVIDTVAAACSGIRYRSKQRVGAVGIRCSSESGSITFTSTRAVVVFKSAGFVSFLSGLLSGVRRLIRDEALPGAA